MFKNQTATAFGCACSFPALGRGMQTNHVVASSAPPQPSVQYFRLLIAQIDPERKVLVRDVCWDPEPPITLTAAPGRRFHFKGLDNILWYLQGKGGLELKILWSWDIGVSSKINTRAGFLSTVLEFNGLVARAETVLSDVGYLIAMNIVKIQQVGLRLRGIWYRAYVFPILSVDHVKDM